MTTHLRSSLIALAVLLCFVLASSAQQPVNVTRVNNLTPETEAATWVVDLDSDESETEIDDTAGCVTQIYVRNRAVTEMFVKVWLDDADNVTVSSTAAGGVFGVAAGFSGNVMTGTSCVAYTNGLSIATVTDEATAAGTGPAANEVVLTVSIKT